MNYSYRAIDQTGLISRGNLDAVNPVDLELRLKRLGLDLITYRDNKSSSSFLSQRVERKELINICAQLAQLLQAGVQIIDALCDLRDTAEPGLVRETLANLVEAIEGGLTLSAAMKAQPKAFDEVFVALVHAGEQSGQLPEVLERLTENLKWQDELASQTKRALSYPIFVGSVVVVVFAVLMLWLVPQLATAMKQLVPKLPPETAFLVSLSGFIRNYWWAVLIAFVAGPAAVFALMSRSSEHWRYELDRLLLRLPFVGRLINKVVMARFSTFFSLLYRSGISVLAAIQICEKIVGNRVIESALKQAYRAISDGQSITQAFATTGYFPPLVLRMLKVGEATGGLDRALDNVSYFFNREVRDTMARLQTMIGPVTTLIVGGLVALIAILMFLPIYDVVAKLKV
jgi:type IV pilus assembly protein PilC